MTQIDITAWGKLNIWPTADNGDFSVRPGLRRIYDPSATGVILAAFSIKNDFSDDVEHVLVMRYTADKTIHLVILDESFTVFQDFTWAASGDPRAVTFGVVEGQCLLTSPDLPTLFHMIGSGVEFATTVQPNPPDGLTAVAVPRGICSVFSNRVVIADGQQLYFSDPVASDGGDLRTFVAENNNSRPGIIYGLHQGAGGMLVTVTSEGTYGLDVDAAAVEQVGSNQTPWRLLSHHGAHSFRSSCEHRGRIYALTADGFAPVDVESMDEMLLADQVMPRARGPRIAMPDFRRCSMYATDEGPIVAAPSERAFHRSNMARHFFSWWRDSTAAPGDVRGVMRDAVGTCLLAFTDGVYRIGGDGDGAVPLAGINVAVVGTIYGKVDSAANQNLLPRKINAAAAVDGVLEILVAVRGSEHGETVDADPMGVIIGSTEWGAADVRYTSTPIANVEINFGDLHDTPASRDVGVEISAQGCLARINTVPDLLDSPSARTRTQKSG